MREENGKTVLVHDHNHKAPARSHHLDTTLIEATRGAVSAAYRAGDPEDPSFNATRMDAYLVACYRAEDAAHFQPITTTPQRHGASPFAVSINLNADFRRRDISFPEYGPQSFKAVRRGRCRVLVFAAARGSTVSAATASLSCRSL